jgi:hypothetical protein
MSVPLVLIVVAASSLFLPLSGATYEDRFHTIFTMVGARALEASRGPSWLGSLLFYGLVALGTFNAIHVAWISSKHRFAPYFLISSGISLASMAIDGYISSRLALPGILGALFWSEAVMTHRGWARVAQLTYQLAWCIAYSLALAAKWGMFGI